LEAKAHKKLAKEFNFKDEQGKNIQEIIPYVLMAPRGAFVGRKAYVKLDSRRCGCVETAFEQVSVE